MFAVKLQQDFDALFMTLNGFASVNLHHQDESVLILSSKHKYVHLKAHCASHTTNYDKNTFIELIPEIKHFSYLRSPKRGDPRLGFFGDPGIEIFAKN